MIRVGYLFPFYSINLDSNFAWFPMNWSTGKQRTTVSTVGYGWWANREASQIQEHCQGSRNSWISQNCMKITLFALIWVILSLSLTVSFAKSKNLQREGMLLFVPNDPKSDSKLKVLTQNIKSIVCTFSH